MSIERERAFYTPTCDVCGGELPPEYDFHDAVDAKKRAGWTSRNVGGDWGDWEDVCCECQALNSEERAADE